MGLFLVNLSLMDFNLRLKSVFVTKLLTSSGILFSTVVNAEATLTSGTLFSTAVKVDFLTKSLTSEIFFSTLLILSSKPDPLFSYLVFKTKFKVSIPFTLETNLSYLVFLTASFFTTLLNN